MTHFDCDVYPFGSGAINMARSEFIISASSNKSSRKRLRSRNKIIDDWLDDENGSDTYADLEDFLVP